MSNLTMLDLFCGGGGSTTGAMQVPGVQVKVAVNHWALAVETHNQNYPSVDHLLTDVSQTDPRYVPHTDLLWASPECTNHSRAKGTRNWCQPDMFGETLPVEAAVRSRATMWDVVRFTETHQYRAVIVENVCEVADWGEAGTMRGGLYKAWLIAMSNLGYRHKVLSLNSMHAQACGLPAPQSRDRCYVIFWRDGVPVPDLEQIIRPQAWCPCCGQIVEAVQWWKNPGRDIDRPGRYRQQYVYHCPNQSCHGQQVEPGWLPAASIIDWTDLGVRIGDRRKPLAPKTMQRIQAGIDRYWKPSPAPAETQPLLVPVEGRPGKQADPAGLPLRTQTCRNETGLAMPPLIGELHGGHSTCRPASQPLATITAGGNHHALVVPYYGRANPVTTEDALPTVTTHDRCALIMRNQTCPGDPGYLSTPADQPIHTLTAAGNQSLLNATSGGVDINDVWFRMLQPDEIKKAMAFPETYRLLGTRREQVRLAGNAVTPPAARDIITAVYQAITEEAVS